jgi:hypothetical protein
MIRRYARQGPTSSEYGLMREHAVVDHGHSDEREQREGVHLAEVKL